jgi:hypothetical protein
VTGVTNTRRSGLCTGDARRERARGRRERGREKPKLIVASVYVPPGGDRTARREPAGLGRQSGVNLSGRGRT